MAEVYIKSEMFLFDRVLNNKRQFNIPEDDNIVETVHITSWRGGRCDCDYISLILMRSTGQYTAKHIHISIVVTP